MQNKCWWMRNNKGMVLLFVIMLIFMETIFAGIVLSIIGSTDRNVQHRVRRIRAYYAVNAARAYTSAKLFTNSWAAGNYAICPTAALCSGYAAANKLIDFDIPYVVTIQVGDFNTGPAGSREIIFSTDYTSAL